VTFLLNIAKNEERDLKPKLHIGSNIGTKSAIKSNSNLLPSNRGKRSWHDYHFML